MNLIIKPIEFYYEDTEFTTEDKADAFGVYDWKTETRQGGPNHLGKMWTYTRPTYAKEWIAAFVEKKDAEFYLTWKQNV